MGHKFSPKLSAPLKDQILANLLRIKSQGSNIQHIKLFDYSIDIFNFEDGSIKLEEQFGSEFLFGYKKFLIQLMRPLIILIKKNYLVGLL